MTIITPYDNKVAVWYHKGSTVTEKTIDELAQNLKQRAPAITQVFVKTSDASDWMARFDTKAAMAISGPDMIKRWVTTLQKYGLEFHAWCVPRGLNVDAEANLIIEASRVPGVRSMILDIEPHTNFWAGTKQDVRALMLKVRSALPAAFHIGMAVDPRPAHYAPIFADEWYPFVNSVHLQLYWVTFGVSPDSAFQTGYKTWANYKRPLFPILQGYQADSTSINHARSLGINTYKSVGLSYWVYGQMKLENFAAANHYPNGFTPAVAPMRPSGTPIVVSPGKPGYADGAYDGVAPSLSAFATYTGANGLGKYHVTDDGVANVWARYDPQIKRSGWYNIEAFVPAQHATTGKARYKLHGVAGQTGETILSVPQYYYDDQWATIGTFQIDTSIKEAGVIYLNDWTFEPGLEIAFDAIRWTPVA
jgi:hypothetical protein